MEYIKIERYPRNTYQCEESSNDDMEILGVLLSRDIEFDCTTLDEWIFDDSQGLRSNCDYTFLEKEGDYIYIGNLYDTKNNPTTLKISRHNLLQLIKDWRERVYAIKPDYVFISYDNDIFTLDAYDNEGLQ